MASERNILAVILISAFFAVVSPLMFNIPEYYLSFLYWTFIYVSMAVAWNILGGFSGYLSFGHVAFLGVGAYAAAVASTHIYPLREVPPLAALALMMILGGLAAAFLALAFGLPFLRLRGPYFTVASLLLVKVVIVLVVNIPALGGGGGLWLPPLPLSISELRYLVYGVATVTAALSVFLAWAVQRSRLGLGLAAIRSDEDVASGLGVNTLKLKLIALGASASLTGAVGAVYAYERGNIYPETVFDLNISVLVVLSALIGGAGHWAGPLVGALLVRVLDEILGTYVGREVARILFGLMLAFVILLRPKGILATHVALYSFRLKRGRGGER